MPRYIDADDLKAVINANDWSNPVVPDVVGIIIDRTPTADVVPKSEVDELAEEYSDLIVEKDQLFDEVVRLRKALDEYEETSGLKQAKVEVAREIFEEIEKAISELDNGSREAKAKAKPTEKVDLPTPPFPEVIPKTRPINSPHFDMPVTLYFNTI